MRTLLKYAKTAATCEIWGNRIFATDMPTCRPKLWTTHMHTHRHIHTARPDPTRPDPTQHDRTVLYVALASPVDKDKSNFLFYLLPAKRDVQLTTRLRYARQYPTIYARTTRYKNSFILFGLNHVLCILCMHDFPVCLFNPAFRGCQNPTKGLCYRSRRVG